MRSARGHIVTGMRPSVRHLAYTSGSLLAADQTTHVEHLAHSRAQACGGKSRIRVPGSPATPWHIEVSFNAARGPTAFILRELPWRPTPGMPRRSSVLQQRKLVNGSRVRFSYAQAAAKEPTARGRMALFVAEVFNVLEDWLPRVRGIETGSATLTQNVSK
jgi:hypothetical protein